MKVIDPRLNDLIARYYPAVFRLAAKFAPSPTRAMELTRRTFERVARQLPRFDSADEIDFLLLASFTGVVTPKVS